jgi:hypothetical protein
MADVDMKDAAAAATAKEGKAVSKSGPSGDSGKPRFEVKKVDLHQ